MGLFLGYVTDAEQVLVDFRLYLPRSGPRTGSDESGAGFPKDVRYRTRHELALEMLTQRGAALPHGWVSGDDEMGRPAWFRQRLATRERAYLLAVPSNTTIRDLEAEPPPYGGRGPHPKPPFVAVRAWCESLPAGAWTRLSVRDGEKGPLEVEIVARRVESKVERHIVGFAETLVVVRYEENGKQKYDYYLSNADRGTPLEEFARVAKAEHRIEECLKRGKSEAGLGDYQVRNWVGWHHHMALSLLAAWFLVGETRRGKKAGAGLDAAPSLRRSGVDLSEGVPLRYPDPQCPRTDALAGAQRTGATVPLQGA